jgi:hypothetical protein
VVEEVRRGSRVFLLACRACSTRGDAKSPVCPRAGCGDDDGCRSLQGNEAQGEIVLEVRKNLNAAREQMEASDRR